MFLASQGLVIVTLISTTLEDITMKSIGGKEGGKPLCILSFPSTHCWRIKWDEWLAKGKGKWAGNGQWGMTEIF